MSTLTSEVEGPRPDANTIAITNIRGELGYAGMKDYELARGLGHSDMWISRRLSSQTPLSVNDLQSIADFFGVEVGELLTHRPRRATGAAGARRSIYLLDTPVGPAGIEPTTSTVESHHLAPVIPLFRAETTAVSVAVGDR